MRYFGKALVSNTILVGGRVIPFIEIAGGFGVVATEDQGFIDALELRIRERRGGISELTQEQYDEELKKKSALPSLPPSQSQRRGISLAEARAGLQPQSDVPAAEVVAESKPAPTTEPATAPAPSPAPVEGEPKISKPTLGKVKR